MTTMTKNSMKSLVLAVVTSAAILGFVAMPAQAASVKVDVSGYDLNSMEGRQSVETRVQSAAEQACSAGGVDTRNLVGRSIYKQCVTDAVATARVQVAQIAGRTQLASR